MMKKKLAKQKNSYHLIKFSEIDSTNNYALAHLNELAHGSVIQAEIQTAGRGQFENRWFSTVPQNIYISIVIKPEIKSADKFIKYITKYTADKVVKVFTEYISRKRIKIKLPNDILIDNKKIAGILTETKFIGLKCLGVVIGMGINLNMPEKLLQIIDQPATALNILVKKKINRNIFLKELLSIFFAQIS